MVEPIRSFRARAVALLLAAAACTSAPPAGTAGTPTPRGNAPPASTPPSASPTPVGTTQRVSRAPCGSDGRIVGFRVAIDDGLEVSRREFAQDVRDILCDERSWIASDAVRFRYDPDGSLLIGLRTPDNAEERCFALIRLSVNRFYSCGTPREVVINADRWLGNSPHFPAPLTAYRQMLINHEVGHALSLHHVQCPRDGAPAPVMMQQSKGMNLNGKTCVPNPWPKRSELDRLR